MEGSALTKGYCQQMSKDLRETSAQSYQDVVMQMEARKWANEFNKLGVPKPVIAGLSFLQIFGSSSAAPK